jgi:hypothetical protein
VFAHDGIPGGQTIDAVRPTGANGAYRIKNVPAGQWLVAAWNCDGSQYQPQYYNLDNGVASDEEADPVTVNANQTTAGIAFKLRPAGSVHVTVTDPNGDPLANVLVVNTDNGEQSCFAGVTGDDGEVTNNGVPPGPTVEHVIDLDGDYDSVDVEINVPVGTTLELPVQMGVATTT